MANASAQLRRIAVKCRAAGNGGAMREMRAGFRGAAEPLKSAVRGAALRQLPHSGGLAQRVAGERITISTLTGARTAGVRMRTSTHDTRATNAGYVRHPVFGTWHEDMPSQQIPQAAGWWSETLRKQSRSVTPALMAVMKHVAAEIEDA